MGATSLSGGSDEVSALRGERSRSNLGLFLDQVVRVGCALALVSLGLVLCACQRSGARPASGAESVDDVPRPLGAGTETEAYTVEVVGENASVSEESRPPSWTLARGDDRTRIEETVTAFVDAWNERKPEALALLFSETGVLHGPSGQSLARGRANIEQALLDEHRNERRMVWILTDVVLLQEEAAMVTGVGTFTREATAAKDTKNEERFRISAVFVREGEVWKIGPCQFVPLPALAQLAPP